MDNRSYRPRPRFGNVGVFLLLAFGISAAPGCSTSGGSGNPPSGNPSQTRYNEVLYMPANFHPSKDNGADDSWGVFALNGQELSQYHLSGTEQPTSGFMALRQADYSRKGASSLSDSIIIAIGEQPAESPRTAALEVENISEIQCPGSVTHVDIRSTPQDYILDEVVSPCGTRPLSERVIRVLYGPSGKLFKITFVKRGGTLDSQQKDQAIQLVSSFSAGQCPSPSADCSLPIFFETGARPAGVTP
jgi:hypothetical protein